MSDLLVAGRVFITEDMNYFSATRLDGMMTYPELLQKKFGPDVYLDNDYLVVHSRPKVNLAEVKEKLLSKNLSDTTFFDVPVRFLEGTREENL